MASLLERLSLPANVSSNVGPMRSKHSNRSSPYSRPNRPPKGDSDSPWSHDLYEDVEAKSRSLSSRIGNPATRVADSNLAQRALREVTGESKIGGGLSIKGASAAASGNVVQVEGLVKGTTPADVEAIFKRCGAIVASSLSPIAPADGVAVRLTFKSPSSAAAAVEKFNGQPADGRTLRVRIVSGVATNLSGRLGSREEDLDDVPMSGGSKMRSDSIIASDPRASVLVAPPGADPKMYLQGDQQLRPQQSQRSRGQWQRGGGRGRRGRRGGGGGGGSVAKMDID